MRRQRWRSGRRQRDDTWEGGRGERRERAKFREPEMLETWRGKRDNMKQRWTEGEEKPRNDKGLGHRWRQKRKTEMM